MIGSDGAEAELDGSMRCIVVMHRLHARECGEVRGQSSNRSGGGGTFFITVSSSAPRRLSSLAIAELQDRVHRLVLCNSLGCRECSNDPLSSMRMVSQPAVHGGRDLSAGEGLCTDAPGPVFLALSAIKQSLPISY